MGLTVCAGRVAVGCVAVVSSVGVFCGSGCGCACVGAVVTGRVGVVTGALALFTAVGRRRVGVSVWGCVGGRWVGDTLILCGATFCEGVV